MIHRHSLTQVARKGKDPPASLVGETAFFEKGDIHVLRYEPIRALVHSGDLLLY